MGSARIQAQRLSAARQRLAGATRTEHEIGRLAGQRASGQSLVELSLVLPLMLLLFLAVADFARLYTTRLTVEAAAREAAEYGTNWLPDLWLPVNRADTEAQMMLRACTAMRNLPDYVGPDTACTNPAVGIELIEEVATKGGAGGVTEDECGDVTVVTRADIPCNVRVTLAYDFTIIVPLRIEFFDLSLGFPTSLALAESSTFALSDFEIDR